ncbi:hypothetical protein AVEN_115156-1 [Araneus ventricosus]|uniref:Mos1 transposase HTH domain-containing protein n=1 Tax=Araneus ventricosus TaxID=182803 RepID=A0A4Y1ZYA3_ARAVE|nr:hypothetical protein AVEN_115156-1 [Araneus ventricosus]
MSRKQVWFWYSEFDNGRKDVRDEQRSGRTNAVTTDVTGTPFLQPGPRSMLVSSLRKKHLGSQHFRTDAEVQRAILA